MPSGASARAGRDAESESNSDSRNLPGLVALPPLNLEQERVSKRSDRLAGAEAQDCSIVDVARLHPDFEAVVEVCQGVHCSAAIQIAIDARWQLSHAIFGQFNQPYLANDRQLAAARNFVRDDAVPLRLKPPVGERPIRQDSIDIRLDTGNGPAMLSLVAKSDALASPARTAFNTLLFRFSTEAKWPCEMIPLLNAR